MSITRYADGRCLSRLTTVRLRPAGAMDAPDRARVRFLSAAGGEKAGEGSGPAPRSGEAAAQLLGATATAAGPVFTVSARRLYDELVPFGPAYHNVRGRRLPDRGRGVGGASPGGITRRRSGPWAPPFPSMRRCTRPAPGGSGTAASSPFPWGSTGGRSSSPTRAGETYRCRIVPLPDEGAVAALRHPDLRRRRSARGGHPGARDAGHLRREAQAPRLGEGGGVGCALRHCSF